MYNFMGKLDSGFYLEHPGFFQSSRETKNIQSAGETKYIQSTRETNFIQFGGDPEFIHSGYIFRNI